MTSLDLSIVDLDLDSDLYINNIWTRNSEASYLMNIKGGVLFLFVCLFVYNLP